MIAITDQNDIGRSDDNRIEVPDESPVWRVARSLREEEHTREGGEEGDEKDSEEVGDVGDSRPPRNPREHASRGLSSPSPPEPAFVAFSDAGRFQWPWRNVSRDAGR